MRVACCSSSTREYRNPAPKKGPCEAPDFWDLPHEKQNQLTQLGVKLKNMNDDGGANFEKNKRVIYLKAKQISGNEDSRTLEHYNNAYAITAMNELMHHARKSGVYTDRMLAQAAFNLLTYGRMERAKRCCCSDEFFAENQKAS